MGTRLACLAYGAAAGTDLSAGAAFLAAGLGRRARDDSLLGLAALAVLSAGAAGLLCWLHGSRGRDQDLWSLNQPFVVATLSAFVPLVWYLGAYWSPRKGEAHPSLAVLYVLVTGLFVANRYDALVAAGEIDTVFLEPFVFPAFVVGVGVHRLRRVRTMEHSFGELWLAHRITKLAQSAVDAATAVRGVLELVGRRVGALAGAALIRTANGDQRLVEWPASPQDAEVRAAAAVVRQATERVGPPPGGEGDAVRVDTLAQHTVAVALVTDRGVNRGILYLVSPASRHAIEAHRRLIELAAGEIGRMVGRLQNLAVRDQRAAADERSRIAQELHDSVSQTLYSIAMVADAFPSVLDQDPTAARQQARQIRSMTLRALGDIRVMLAEMRESAQESASLEALVHQIATNAAGLVTVEIDAREDPALPAEVKVAAYRIAQQAVVNARQHAAPREIVVRLRARAGAVSLSVTDDGSGFDVAAVPPGRHGLEIMRERAVGVGGDLRIESEPGRGTRVRFSWPAVSRPTTGLTET